jgi:hypothetical protein
MIATARPCAAILTLSLALATLLSAQSAVATSITNDDECWKVMNELAAAVVFADLAEEKETVVFGLLDTLQDQCDAKQFADATKTMTDIEAHVGK